MVRSENLKCLTSSWTKNDLFVYLDDLSDTKGEVERFVPIFWGIELAPVEQTTRVMHAQLVTYKENHLVVVENNS